MTHSFPTRSSADLREGRGLPPPGANCCRSGAGFQKGGSREQAKIVLWGGEMMSLKHAALIASSAAASLLMIGAAGEASEQSGELTIYTSMAEPAINAVEKAFRSAEHTSELQSLMRI